MEVCARSACHVCTNFCVKNEQSSHFSFVIRMSEQQNPCSYHAILTSISAHPSLCSPIINCSRSSHVCSVKFESPFALSIAMDDESDFLISHGSQKSVQIDEGAEIMAECLNLLEWPLICNQIADFANTSMGAAAARNAQIRIGESQQESEELLNQTAEVLSLSCKLDFSGISDVRNIVSKAVSGEICSVCDLCLVKNTLASAQRLADQILEPDGDSQSLCKETTVEAGRRSALRSELRSAPGSEFGSELRSTPRSAHRSTPSSALGSIMANCDLCPELRRELERCVDSSLEIVLDRASKPLESVRESRRANMKTLEDLLKLTAGRVMAAGGMDSAIVTKRRGGRLCVAVRTTHRHLVTGGVVLDVSNTGATVFMEPQPALDLNNRETFLSVREQEEEKAVLKTLTARVMSVGEKILKLCDCITCLDLACARAAHAKWLGAVRPTFHPSADITASMNSENLSEQKAPEEEFVIFMEGVRHPLLLGSALSKTQHSSSIQRMDNKLKECIGQQPDLPVPIDVKVKSGVKGVVLSGPNTGGKTAALKTVGIAVLMSKAGLFIPVEGRPILPWFTRVLAHIGDNQSLQQNLSTFSGHIKQLCKILDSGDAGALVLLDEIGGGTDPSEGAALATAVLKHLVTFVKLTVATTHCMELKDLGIQDQRFENAALEFDIRTLRPTYRVLWGQVGESNALDIVESLDFDPAVVSKARRLLTKLAPDGLRASQSELTVQLLQQLEEEKNSAKAAAANFSQIQKLYNELVLESSNLEVRTKKLKYQNQRAINHEVAEAESSINKIVSEFQASQDGGAGTTKTLSLRDAQAAVSSILAEYSKKYKAMLSGRGKTSDEAGESVPRLPQFGEKVIVRTLGKKQGIVIESAKTCSDYLTVRVGILNIRVKSSEVIPC